jgi:predicted adenylyl cyclase CyaB
MSGPGRNVELKAKCPDLSAAAEAVRRHGATFVQPLRQVDTYFHVPHGRLKLRATEGERAELIWYARDDTTDFRGSDYHIVPIADPSAAKTALTAALGLRGEVRKRRELWLWHNVRIHLDHVDGLGDFVEFEAVLTGESDEVTSLARLAVLAKAMKIEDADRIAVSYCDLLGS